MEIHGGNITLDDTQAQLGAGVDERGYFRVTHWNPGFTVALELMKRLKLEAASAVKTAEIVVTASEVTTNFGVAGTFPDRLRVHNHGSTRANVTLTTNNTGDTVGPFTVWPKAVLDRSSIGGFREVIVAREESGPAYVSVEASYA